MANHKDASADSGSLCDRLLAGLKGKVPNVVREKGDNWCGFRAEGMVFAYGWHSTSDQWLKIWFRGTAASASAFPKLTIKPRNPTSGSWKKFGGSFKIYNEAHLQEAIELLSKVSYPLSLSGS